MERSVYIKIICFFLCISMLSPVAASATTLTPIYSYSTVEIPAGEGETTKRMAYVDQFFNHAGGYSDEGYALEKWLDPQFREEGTDRMNSGYLMLEQEMNHQKSGRYKAADVYIQGTRLVMNNVSNPLASVVVWQISDLGFKQKFPKAGKDAYVYYSFLYQILYQYAADLQSELKRAADITSIADSTFGLAENSMDIVEAEISATSKAYIKGLGHTVEFVNVSAEYYAYIQNKSNTEKQQLAYFNVARELEEVTQVYIDMLDEWADTIRYTIQSETEDDEFKEANECILDAVSAMLSDIVSMRNETVEGLNEHAKEDARNFTAGDISDIIVNAILEVTDILAEKNDIMDVLTLFEDLSKTDLAKIDMGLNVVDIGAVFLNATTDRFVEFGEKSEAIYNLKLSLFDLLTNSKTGLLARYRDNRTDENASAIINALETMKKCKIAGENLVEEYYLYDLYKSLDLDVSGPVHTVLRNELAKNNIYSEIDASDCFTPIIGVYKDTVTEREGSYNGFKTWVSAVDTEILGYYCNTKGITYKGVELKRTPGMCKKKEGNLTYDIFFSRLPKAPSQFEHEVRGSTTLSQKWLNGETVNIVQEYRRLCLSLGKTYNYSHEKGHLVYVDDKLKLYSSNGVDVILTNDEYNEYLGLQEYLNGLLERFSDEYKKISILEKDEHQYVCRLEWTGLTRKWIEKIKMFDPNGKYEVY